MTRFSIIQVDSKGVFITSGGDQGHLVKQQFFFVSAIKWRQGAKTNMCTNLIYRNLNNFSTVVNFF